MRSMPLYLLTSIVFLAVATPSFAATCTIDFQSDVGLLTYQTGPSGHTGTLTASGGHGVFSGIVTCLLQQNHSLVSGSATVSATISLAPYPDALNGVGIIFADVADSSNQLTATVYGSGDVYLSGMYGQQSGTFDWPAALNSLTLQYDPYMDRATLYLNGSATVFLEMALGANAVYVGVFADGTGQISSFSANGYGIPVYPTAPAISQQPTSQSVNAGASANFSVGAAKSGSLTYQWSENGKAIDGATLASLTIPNAQVGDQGSYTCTVANAAGSTTSNAAALTVNGQINGPYNWIGAGQPVQLEFYASGMAPGWHYQWSKNGAALSGETNASLVLDPADSIDTGPYACHAVSASSDTFDPTFYLVVAGSSLPVAGVIGLGAVIVLLASCGGRSVRRRAK